MVAIGKKKKDGFGCVPSCQIPRWLFVVGLSVVFLLINSAWDKIPDVQLNGTVATKLETVFVKPDGLKDYNLKKRNTTSFKGFSFYLMGDTPVSLFEAF